MMTIDEFRRIALSMPEAEEKAHMGHPDFRVGNKVFATLGYPDDGVGMVKLNPEQQDSLMRAEPAVYVAVKGGWGRQGATYVRLAEAKADSVRAAMASAWRNTAPKRLAARFGAKP